ncbi:coenzyme F420 hydrogenase [Methanosarcinales archaeon ex4572_44]|nr:MAG: coenzyme F420 hydrogenase [Methanosarcinales archaeon ex4572_44]
MKFDEKGSIIDLEAKVVYSNICCYCGACGAFCTEYISYENGTPITKQKCFEIHGACFDFCPRTFLPVLEMERELFGDVRNDSELGYYTSIVTAQASDAAIAAKGQNGSVVTALLIYLMEKGKIDAACVSKNSLDEPWKPEPLVATTKEEILEGAGSNYEQCPTIMGVGEALANGSKNIAMVGLPCHIQAMRKIQLSKAFDVGGERVKYAIGLLCTETFDRDLLHAKLAEMGIKAEDVKKFDIGEGKFKVFTEDGMTTEKIATMKSCMRDGCKVCYDFAAELADISVGSIGSEEGWNTVIVRSKAGKELIDEAKKAGAIKVKPLGDASIKSVKDLASRKKSENIDNIVQMAGATKILHLAVKPQELSLLLSAEK